MNECYLSEIYSAIQGEGTLVGVRQIFVRLSACDLRCTWCDTPDSLVRTEFCEIENHAGTRSFQKIKNPITGDKLIESIKNLQPELHQSISLTGGEPLLQSKFLLTVLPQIKLETSLPIYLETGGHRPNELKSVIKFLDYISMDFKLPTSAKTGTFWEKHKDFLDISLAAKKNVWVKIVITADTSCDDLIASVNLIKSLNGNGKSVEIFLQPVTEINCSKPPNESDLLEIHSKLLKLYPHVRVVPQVHKLIGQR